MIIHPNSSFAKNKQATFQSSHRTLVHFEWNLLRFSIRNMQLNVLLVECSIWVNDAIGLIQLFD